MGRKVQGADGPLKLPGRLAITRSMNMSDPNDRAVNITVTDQVSGTRVLEASMTLHEFALALMGLSEQPMEMEIYTSAPWGLKHENKTIPCQVPGDVVHDIRAERGPKRLAYLADLEAALKMHQVDGWKADESSAQNWHNVLGWDAGRLFKNHNEKPIDDVTTYARPEEGRRYYMVTFHRYVPVKR